MEKFKILKEYFKENKQRFHDMSKNMGDSSEFYLACVYSNFIRIFLATGNLEYAEKCLEQNKERKIIQNDSFYYPSEVDDVSNYFISRYYFDVLKLSPKEALEKYVSSIGGYAFHGFTNYKHNTITKEGLKVEHVTDEHKEIEGLPLEIKNDPYFFRYYFLDSKNAINLASLPRVAFLFANSGTPEWFKMFCTGEVYPYDEFFRAKKYEPIHERIVKKCQKLSAKERNQVLKFLNKYWNRYINQEEEADNLMAVIKTKNYLEEQIKALPNTKEEFDCTISHFDYNNIVIQRDVGLDELCILDVPKPIEIKKENFDTEYNYLSNFFNVEPEV